MAWAGPPPVAVLAFLIDLVAGLALSQSRLTPGTLVFARCHPAYRQGPWSQAQRHRLSLPLLRLYTV